jgi:very-short-patch-repair endonuclease
MRVWDATHRITKGQPVDPAKKELARRMRHAPTASERIAWKFLRNRRMLGLKFRRQQVILGFIADFFCAEERLVLEIDGSSHEPLERQVQDEERSLILARLDLKVVRIRSDELNEQALRTVLERELGVRRHPVSLQGEGDGG